MLTAHLRQAQTMLRRVKESERLWNQLEELIDGRKLPPRTMSVLFDAASGLRVRNGTYRASMENADEELTEQTASRDLQGLTRSGLLVARGQARGRYYVASNEVAAIRQRIIDARDPRDDRDPFAG
jgi:hypothetical protein